MASKEKLKELLFSLFDESDDADEIKNTLRGMVAEWQLEQDDYNTILEHWEDWLSDWQLAHQKHDNYDQNEEVLEELGEHLESKKF